jgi:hypothetical protein
MLRLRGRSDEIQICSDSILDRAWERILGTEAVVDGCEKINVR